jgi:hypothetical protein
LVDTPAPTASINALSGSYVLPADVTGAVGSNILGKMFSSGPYGVTPLRSRGYLPQPHLGGLKVAAPLPRSRSRNYAQGGRAGTIERVTVKRGSFVISPEVVRKVGHGSLKAGEKVLDQFVKKVRAEASPQ